MVSKSFFNLIVNNFLEHVFVLNKNREIIFQTSNNSSLLGYSDEEILKDGFQSLFINPLFLFDEALDKAMKYGEYYNTENFKHKTKKYINIAFRILYQEDEANSESYFVFYLRDNTQQNLVRKDIIKKSWRAFTVVCICLAVSAFYELIEWWTSVLTGESGDAFLGTQGYEFDTQSDMLFAMIGVISALLLISKIHDKQIKHLS